MLSRRTLLPESLVIDEKEFIANGFLNRMPVTFNTSCTVEIVAMEHTVTK
ncbi:hypothetical protein Pmar_PMAR027064 [Perkinsus marinus ATCC 50983]|uniref:Uncharacterized protein n=1 Tax=Perkinsus marinus (strain ATCC 50983 / TXsc) TaxID=423536 RepID=C5LFK1_PERM5|nr:hypothetical protein Pmar_PMAR027064 [Perkinsus marinus ATCC 50983]EER04491.1 hypothetical protein Pmar_PMAR027064 [Perkinsus marinus ATCC 50983]|eukprot:XP_002772675.1 hypothetical protein Pmar_PMAR027064 [Perkinsus marinus ATCC 50983]